MWGIFYPVCATGRDVCVRALDCRVVAGGEGARDTRPVAVYESSQPSECLTRVHVRAPLCSIRRRFSRGLPYRYSALLKKLRKAKKEAPMHDKPEAVKTHLRNMVILPEMIGSVVGVYNGKTYVGVEIKVPLPPPLTVPGGTAMRCPRLD